MHICLPTFPFFIRDRARRGLEHHLLAGTNEPCQRLGRGEQSWNVHHSKKKTGKNTVDEDDEDMELYRILGFDMS